MTLDSLVAAGVLEETAEATEWSPCATATARSVSGRSGDCGSDRRRLSDRSGLGPRSLILRIFREFRIDAGQLLSLVGAASGLSGPVEAIAPGLWHLGRLGSRTHGSRRAAGPVASHRPARCFCSRPLAVQFSVLACQAGSDEAPAAALEAEESNLVEPLKIASSRTAAVGTRRPCRAAGASKGAEPRCDYRARRAQGGGHDRMARHRPSGFPTSNSRCSCCSAGSGRRSRSRLTCRSGRRGPRPGREHAPQDLQHPRAVRAQRARWPREPHRAQASHGSDRMAPHGPWLPRSALRPRTITVSD